MNNILWVQTKTETGRDTILKNGCQGGQDDYDAMLAKKRSILWEQLTPEPYNVKRFNDIFYVEGYLENVDYLNSKLPFSFLCYSTSFRELFEELKIVLETVQYNLNEESVNRTIARLEHSNISVVGASFKMSYIVNVLEKLVEICKKAIDFGKKHPKKAFVISLILMFLLLFVVKKCN